MGDAVLDWEYGTIWQFIRQYSMAYCPLYDQGYSSVGLVANTARNPLLVKKNADGPGSDGGGSGSYHPAWFLDSSTTERGGRDGSGSCGSADGEAVGVEEQRPAVVILIAADEEMGWVAVPRAGDDVSTNSSAAAPAQLFELASAVRGMLLSCRGQVVEVRLLLPSETAWAVALRQYRTAGEGRYGTWDDLVVVAVANAELLLRVLAVNAGLAPPSAAAVAAFSPVRQDEKLLTGAQAEDDQISSRSVIADTLPGCTPLPAASDAEADSHANCHMAALAFQNVVAIPYGGPAAGGITNDSSNGAELGVLSPSTMVLESLRAACMYADGTEATAAQQQPVMSALRRRAVMSASY